MYNTNQVMHLNSLAIIGMSLRFPDAKNPEQFWQNLIQGKESVQQITDTVLSQQGVSDVALQHPHYVKKCVVLDNVDKFDAPFFSITARDATFMDPQQRLLLECAYEAFERAGYVASECLGPVGVYVGHDISRYYLKHLQALHQQNNAQEALQLLYNNTSAATQISYKLNLRGPSLDVNTACSTSLSAIHLACQSLLNYECDMALAGGASIDPDAPQGYLYQEGGILSPDGHCRPFSSDAKGTIAGNGVGLIVLKRLEDAINDRDFIHAVIRGSSMNNDGAQKIGYTAPSVDGQTQVVLNALAAAEVSAESINYIECHGTATPLGDPIEIAALTKAFQQTTRKLGYCYIGSVKSNIGHLSAAAGVAGVIKTALAIQFKQIPPSLNCPITNPNIPFNETPFQVNTTFRDWQTQERRAGVSSFGIGGTNVHIILEQPPLQPTTPSKQTMHVLCLSAKSQTALNDKIVTLSTFLQEHPELLLADVAYTLQIGREKMAYKQAFIAATTQEAIAKLEKKHDINQDKDMASCPAKEFATTWLNTSTEEEMNFYHNEKRQRLPLPTYPFEKIRYWVDLTTTQQTQLISPQHTYHTRPELPYVFTELQTPLQHELASIWSKLLGIKPIGLDDNFFDLNGDSLTLTQVAAWIYDHYHIKLRLDSLFENATIDKMAALIETSLSDTQVSQPKHSHATTGLVSLAQQRLWFLEQIENIGVTYNMPAAIELRGPLSHDTLTKSLKTIMKRHAILRSSLHKTDAGIMQTIHEHEDIRIPIRLISKDKLNTAITQEVGVSFDLSRSPLMRACLFQLSAEHHIFLITMHHVITDGWSQRILLNELAITYTAHVHNQTPDLPTLSEQYIHYSEWQRQLLKEKEFQQQLQYWQAKLEDMPSLIELPTDFPRPNTQTYRGDSLTFTLPEHLISHLFTLGKTENATLFMVIFAAFNVLLHRYSGKDDIVVGVPIAGRSRQAFESLIGFFVNTLVLRTKLDAQKTFRQLLALIREEMLAAYSHQDVPFDKLVEVLQPERNLSYSPLVQVEFAWQNKFDMVLQLPELEAHVFPLESSVAKFDVTFYMQEMEDSVQGLVEYNIDLFEKSTIQRMITHFETLLYSITIDFDKAINALNILPEAEYKQLLVTWNTPVTTYPIPQKTAHILFAEQANKTPDAICISHHGDSLTYGEVEEKSNQWAHYILSHGIKREDRITLYLERGIAFLVTMLGIMKSGGVFIPMNPSSSIDRNLDILRHSEPTLVICDIDSADRLSSHISTPLIRYADKLTYDYPKNSVQIAQNLSDLACFFYTSGSTGQPKGVMVEHWGLVNHLFAKINDLSMTAEDNVAQIAVQTFDVCVWQYLSALIVGGRIVVLTGPEAWEPKPLLTAIAREKISIVESVPSHTHILLDELENPKSSYDCPMFRYYVSNGEPMPKIQAERWYRCLPHVALVNTYGATECSDDVSHFHVPKDYVCKTPYIPTKDVLPHLKLYILDTLLNPVPIGIIGEVYVGGVGVGRGYFKDDEKTKTAFIESPFDDEFPKLYRTGDLARYHVNGEMEFIGRADFQVKIRGFRVEIGEVESVITQHPNVQQVLTLAWKDKKGVQHLVAYIVPKNHPAPTVEELSQFCLSKLPYYMVPSTFMFLDAFPLSANGKMNRKQLPEPNEQDLTKNENYTPPRNALEQDLTDIWASMLGLEKVGIRDNFFQIGGHSLLAVDLVTKLQQREMQVELRHLFDRPTIETLVEILI